MLFLSTQRLSASSRLPARINLLPILVSLAQVSASLDPSATVSVDQLPAYSQQRLCGRGCIQNNFDGGPDIEYELGCTWNGCYCGTQYQPAATSILKSCWSEFCGTSEANLLTYDISTALSIYDAYCGGAAAAAPTSVPATTTTTGNINAATSGPSNNQLPSQTNNGNSGTVTGAPSPTASSKSSSSPLSSGGIAGIAITGATSLIGLCVTIWFKYLRHKLAVRRDKRNEMQQMQQMQQRGWY